MTTLPVDPHTPGTVLERPRRLHRRDCYHLTIPNPGAAPSAVRLATVHEART